MFEKVQNIYKISRAKNSVIGIWLKSIVILLCVSALFALQSFFVSDWLFMRSADQANRLLMDQVAVAIDVEIHSAQQMLSKLLTTRGAKRIAQSEDVYDIALTPSKMELMEQIFFFCLTSDLVDDIEMYFPEQDYLVSSTTVAESFILHYADYKDYVENYEEWRTLFLHHRTGDVFILTTAKNQPRTGKSKLFYVQSGADVPAGANAMAYFSIDGSSFLPQISAMSAGNDFAVMKPDGTVFVSSNYDFFKELSGEARLLDTLSACDRDIARLPVRSGNVYMVKSAYADLCYVIHTTSEHGIYGRLPLAVVSILGIAAILAVSVMLILRHTENTITPLMEIRGLLATGDLHQEDSELKQIRDAIYASHEQVATISSELNVNQAKLQRSYLQALLLGNTVEEDEARMTAELGFDRPGFAVMMFALVDDEQPLSENTEAAVFLVLRYDVMCQMLESTGVTLKYLLFDDAFVVAANMNGEDASNWDSLANGAAHDLMTAWEEQFDRQLTYAYSGVHVGLEGLARSYAEARLTMRYKLLNDLAYAGETRDAQGEARYCFPVGERNRLINLIKGGAQEETSRLIDELWQENTGSEFSDILLDCLSNDIAGAIMSVSGSAQRGSSAEREFFTNLAYMQKQRPEYRKDSLIQLAAIASEQFRAEKANEQADFYDEIVRYVEAQYSDPMLSVESICSHFGRSHNTVYSAVKARSGEGVLHLINIVRLQKAKELMRQSDATVEKTAKDVGLNSSLALFRIFKRYEGMTPSQFMNQSKPS